MPTMLEARWIAETTALLAARDTNQSITLSRVPSHLHAVNAMELHRIATRLHRYDERNCNEDLGCRVCDGNGTVDGKAIASNRQEIIAVKRPCKACAGKGHTLGRREAKNEARAVEIAASYNLRVYFQGDCRGCPIYLIPNETPAREGGDASWYSSIGTAVCHLG